MNVTKHLAALYEGHSKNSTPHQERVAESRQLCTTFNIVFFNPFEFDKNGKQFSKRVENTVGKGEIAHDEQFLLFPQCFQRICTADT